ncbi:VIP36-like protein [Leptonychotes weddellii]|uniref:VIP36-like protein n=1 Tax=Leptonychotes weddellii TaxID=9713 RepID=A0A7F8QW58_LEPWE|nr:VIP36-like protein [Leptonychotes weddellii]
MAHWPLETFLAWEYCCRPCPKARTINTSQKEPKQRGTIRERKSVEDGGEEETKQDHILDSLGLGAKGRKEAGAQVEPLEAQKRRYSPGVQRVFPYISAMVNNGSLSYDHERDGRPTELGGCTAIVRNLHYDTFLVIRYVKRHLTIMMDIDGKHEWRDCIEVPGVRLPRGYYFGTSSITGDLSGTVTRTLYLS